MVRPQSRSGWSWEAHLAQVYDDLRGMLRRPAEDREFEYREQLDALRFYLDERVRILRQDRDPLRNSWGTCKALLEFNGHYFVWRDSFGSCDGCDALGKSEDAFEYIQSTFTVGVNLRGFSKREPAEKEYERDVPLEAFGRGL